MLVPSEITCSAKKKSTVNSDCFGGGSWPSQYFLCHVISPEQSKVLTDKRASDRRGTLMNFPRIQITHITLVDPELHHTNYEHPTPILKHPSQWHPSNAVGVRLTVKRFPNSNCLSAHTYTTHATCACAHTHTRTHTVVHKMHTVVHYTLVCTTHSGTQQVQQCTTHTVVHDTRTFGLAEG